MQTLQLARRGLLPSPVSQVPLQARCGSRLVASPIHHHHLRLPFASHQGGAHPPQRGKHLLDFHWRVACPSTTPEPAHWLTAQAGAVCSRVPRGGSFPSGPRRLAVASRWAGACRRRRCADWLRGGAACQSVSVRAAAAAAGPPPSMAAAGPAAAAAPARLQAAVAAGGRRGPPPRRQPAVAMAAPRR